MFTCVICRFDVEMDDTIAPTASGRCVCVRCFARETETSRPMSKDLRRDLISTLATDAVR
ncbi:MAG: hypothetical protein ACR2PL_10535 [Dehalococcoidia bacterium]